MEKEVMEVDVPRVVTDALYSKLVELYRICADLYAVPLEVVIGGTEGFQHALNETAKIKELIPQIEELISADQDYWQSFVDQGEQDEQGETPTQVVGPE
jgi:hypothetical protein